MHNFSRSDEHILQFGCTTFVGQNTHFVGRMQAVVSNQLLFIFFAGAKKALIIWMKVTNSYRMSAKLNENSTKTVILKLEKSKYILRLYSIKTYINKRKYVSFHSAMLLGVYLLQKAAKFIKNFSTFFSVYLVKDFSFFWRNFFFKKISFLISLSVFLYLNLPSLCPGQEQGIKRFPGEMNCEF